MSPRMGSNRTSEIRDAAMNAAFGTKEELLATSELLAKRLGLAMDQRSDISLLIVSVHTVSNPVRQVCLWTFHAAKCYHVEVPRLILASPSFYTAACGSSIAFCFVNRAFSGGSPVSSGPRGRACARQPRERSGRCARAETNTSRGPAPHDVQIAQAVAFDKHGRTRCERASIDAPATDASCWSVTPANKEKC
jgi:hypothetical protein